ncbi:hypothetical protein BLA24_00840 [Streptomyces cinnamoneus]|uniref:Uncharacterized protein n=1 Tax=Streptomyces cinnamoneus TaxID=53446 RepID=A0A2G1XQL8_STRCJ|nr:hypothetical protein [Streptomyces cinnamoneus]PHQ53510.1 hypothetical protein BLA24_00840 [Streptomyces cinnamoneus]PPT12815.1 hypothetical protein CYQ11_07850 [Streptomyces cinnamoneus]
MGWTVLYIAFGVVALWLLGEVLLQYKARLRWRLLAFVGFLGVVAGVVIPSVAVIVVGAVAFAVGQTFVTLSFRRGFSRGWAIRRGEEGAAAEPGRGSGKGESRAAGKSRAEKSRSGRRRKGGDRAQRSAAGVTAPVSGPDAPPTAGAGEDDRTELMPSVPQQPTGESAQPAGYGGGYGADTNATGTDQDGFPAYGSYAAAQPAEAPAAPGGYAGQFDYGQGQYAAYSDPYIGNRPPSYEQYDAYGQQQAYPQQQYGTTAYPGDTYATPQQYDVDTPPGGVWVPQQRDTDHPAGQAPPPEQYPGQQQPPYPPQQPGQGFDEQRYRY